MPYCELSLSATVAKGSITATPSHVVLNPVPLGVSVKEEFHIVMNGFE